MARAIPEGGDCWFKADCYNPGKADCTGGATVDPPLDEVNVVNELELVREGREQHGRGLEGTGLEKGAGHGPAPATDVVEHVEEGDQVDPAQPLPVQQTVQQTLPVKNTPGKKVGKEKWILKKSDN